MTEQELCKYIGKEVSFDLVPYSSPIFNIGISVLDKYTLKGTLIELKNNNVRFGVLTENEGLCKIYHIDWITNFQEVVFH